MTIQYYELLAGCFYKSRGPMHLYSNNARGCLASYFPTCGHPNVHAPSFLVESRLLIHFCFFVYAILVIACVYFPRLVISHELCSFGYHPNQSVSLDFNICFQYTITKVSVCDYNT